MVDAQEAGGWQKSDKFHTHGDNDEAQNSSYDVEKKQENAEIPLPHGITTINGLHISVHRLKWCFKMEGIPQRSPTKEVKMRSNWVRRYWNGYKKVNIVANRHVLEVWVKVGKRKSAKIALSEAWNKVDLARREFSQWQKIALTPVKTTHPLDLERGHFVLEDKKLEKYLKNEAGKPTSGKIGLIFDKSHANKHEFTGEYSAEGAVGADYIFLHLPTEFRGLKAKFERVNEEIKGIKEDFGIFREEQTAIMGLIEGENRVLAESSAKNLECTTEIMRILKQRGRQI